MPATGTAAMVLHRLLRSPLLRMLYFVLLLALFGYVARWISQTAGIPATNLKQMSGSFTATVLVVLPFLLAYVLLVRVIERRPLHELAWRKSPQLLLGLLAALLLFILITLELWMAGAYTIQGVGGAPLWTLFLLTAVVPGVTEEIISRGILFRLTEEGLGTWIALVVSALFFGFAHSANPGATSWTSLAIALEAGVLFGLLY
ncbi:MAG: CPBP family intramembrane metalloprotease, partial [Burkholderiales bacterium]